MVLVVCDFNLIVITIFELEIIYVEEEMQDTAACFGYHSEAFGWWFFIDGGV